MEEHNDSPALIEARARLDAAKQKFETAGSDDVFVKACRDLRASEDNHLAAKSALAVASQVTRPPQLDMPPGVSGGPGLPTPKQPGFFERLASSLTSLMGGEPTIQEPESPEARAETEARFTYNRNKGVFDREHGRVRRLAFDYLKAVSDLNGLEGKRTFDNAELNAAAKEALLQLPVVVEQQLGKYIVPTQSNRNG